MTFRIVGLGRSLRNLEEIHVLQSQNLRQVLGASFKIREYYFCCFVPLSNSKHLQLNATFPMSLVFIKK